MVQRENGGKEKGGSVEKRGDVFIFTFSMTGLAAIKKKKSCLNYFLNSRA